MFVFALVGCPSPPPAPPVAPVDASDAAPLPLLDAGSPACQLACKAMLKATCIVLDDCAITLTNNVSLIRNPITQRPLTCEDLENVQSQTDVQKLGQKCGP